MRYNYFFNRVNKTSNLVTRFYGRFKLCKPKRKCIDNLVLNLFLNYYFDLRTYFYNSGIVQFQHF